MSKSLVAFDTDRVKDYVFGTRTLKEIRGGSALLDELNRERMLDIAGVPEKDVIYANGGGGLFVVETEQADDVIQAVRKAYRDETVTASITGASIRLRDAVADDVGDKLDTVRRRLRAAKDRRSEPMYPVTHPLMHFCDACGTYYASQQQGGDMLCRTCLVKREKDQSLKDEIKRLTKPDANLDPESSRLWERLIGRLASSEYPTAGYGRPEDFHSLGAVSHPRGYMGLIYADGDGMGREIDEITGLEELNRFADGIDHSVYRVVEHAIKRHLCPTSPGSWPFDILLLGGDDLVMVTRAQSAMDVAQLIVERFPEMTEEICGRRLSLSASVVLAHVNFPIGPLMGLAESGLKFAKREAARRRHKGDEVAEGLINFLVVSSPNHLDFETYYNRTLKDEVRAQAYYQDAEMLYRTQRPYTAQGCAQLLRRVRHLREIGMPRAKLQQLRTAVFKSRKQATIDAMMAVLRLRDEDQRQELFKLVGTDTAEKLRIPWVKQGDRWTTPILDVVELFDFVR